MNWLSPDWMSRRKGFKGNWFLIVGLVAGAVLSAYLVIKQRRNKTEVKKQLATSQTATVTQADKWASDMAKLKAVASGKATSF